MPTVAQVEALVAKFVAELDELPQPQLELLKHQYEHELRQPSPSSLRDNIVAEYKYHFAMEKCMRALRNLDLEAYATSKAKWHAAARERLDQQMFGTTEALDVACIFVTTAGHSHDSHLAIRKSGTDAVTKGIADDVKDHYEAFSMLQAQVQKLCNARARAARASARA